jgi:hypothetical protein
MVCFERLPASGVRIASVSTGAMVGLSKGRNALEQDWRGGML